MTEEELIFNGEDMSEDECIKFVKDYMELAHIRAQELLAAMQEKGP